MTFVFVDKSLSFLGFSFLIPQWRAREGGGGITRLSYSSHALEGRQLGFQQDALLTIRKCPKRDAKAREEPDNCLI